MADDRAGSSEGTGVQGWLNEVDALMHGESSGPHDPGVNHRPVELQNEFSHNPLDHIPIGAGDTYIEGVAADITSEGLEFAGAVWESADDVLTDIGDQTREILVEWWNENAAPWFSENTNNGYNHLVHFLGTIMFGLTTLADKSFRKNYGVGDIVRTPNIPSHQIAPFELPDRDDFLLNILEADRIGSFDIGSENIFECRVHLNVGLFTLNESIPRNFDLPSRRVKANGVELIRVGEQWASNMDDEWISGNTQQAYQGYGGVTPVVHELQVSPFVTSVENPGWGIAYVQASWDTRDSRILNEDGTGDDPWNLDFGVIY